MFTRLLIGLCVFTSLIFSADATGTWKLNTAKSKYEGMPAPKEMTVVYSPQGSGWRYQATGTTATGDPINSSFTYVKDGEEMKTTGFPNWDALVLNGAAAAKSTGKLLRGGKQVGTVTRTIAGDGKTMTIRGSLTMPDGKKATYLSIYDKQ